MSGDLGFASWSGGTGYWDWVLGAIYGPSVGQSKRLLAEDDWLEKWVNGRGMGWVWGAGFPSADAFLKTGFIGDSQTFRYSGSHTDLNGPFFAGRFRRISMQIRQGSQTANAGISL